ncbi:aspartic peptidase domain-containing protein [Mycena rosella]|uniref:Aspartic peptidase domain-containing protein n=1 Tax=Mycena rosella TaxID=1033263 RepID=A0AAD7GMA6_MYCRO|nr:aspartic peptidase domain-containing protein [Mycena rosella]
MIFLFLLNTAVACAASTASVVTSSTASAVHFPLTRRIGHPAGLRYGALSGGTVRERYRLSRQDLSLEGDDRVHPGYFVNIGIGTPSQTLAVLVSTSDAGLWVAQDACSDCTGSSSLYDSTASTTFFQFGSVITSISYSSGQQVSGTVVRDTVQLGPYTVASQVFCACHSLFSVVIEMRPCPSVGPEMAFWLKRGAQHESFGGAFTFGGTNSSWFQGDIEFLPLPSNGTGRWQLDVSGITVQGKVIEIASGVALSTIDIGVVGIGGPVKDVEAIWAAVPGSTASTSSPGFYEYPCNTTVNITVSFGGKAWPINPADINLGPTSDGACLGAISVAGEGIGKDSEENWVFGIAFLTNVYSVFRMTPPSIGFAQLSALASDPSFNGSSGSGSSSTPATSPTLAAQSTHTSAGSVPHRNTISPGVIVGIVLAGLAVIFMSVGVWLYLRRRRRRTADELNHVRVFPNDETTADVLVSVQRQPPMRGLSTMKREQVEFVRDFNNTRTATDDFVQTKDGVQLLPGRSPQTQADANGANIRRSATDPLLNELRSLRAEMRRLATERESPDAPPSYARRDVY